MDNISQDQIVIICGGAKEPALERIDDLIDRPEQAFVIGVDRGALELIRAGYQLDLALGDFDSVNAKELATIRDNSLEVLEYDAEKDDTDMEIAIEYSTKHFPHGQYMIFGAIGEQEGRLDHMLANLWLAYQARFQAHIDRFSFLEKNHRIRYYSPGQHLIRAEADVDYLSIISMTPVSNLSITNAVYNLKEQDFAYPRALISNEFISSQDDIHLSFSTGLVLVLWVKEEKGD